MDLLTPAAIPGVADAAALASATSHSCVIRADLTVACWGSNDQGQLGNGATGTSTSPVAVAGLSEPVFQISVNRARTCAVVGTGDVWCWGEGDHGELGNGTIGGSTSAVQTLFE
jgi:alpha-tubulin suppressor-like RCC1 family protein